MSEQALNKIAGSYTREAGVRGLDRVVATLARKTVRRLVEDADVATIDVDDLTDLLGPEPFQQKSAEPTDEVGVTTGLAVTGAGGDVLFVEASLLEGSGTVTLTGQLGDVMRESAQAAMTYARVSGEGRRSRRLVRANRHSPARTGGRGTQGRARPPESR